MEKRSSSQLAKWLDGLARESWELELLISGFTIFLLIGIYDPLRDLGQEISRLDLNWQMQNFVSTPYAIAHAAWYILVINLCIHVLFRGLWISTIGLRSVSDDIDFDSLKLQPTFDRFLRRRIGSFDRYIERLEKISSVLFAFTFLILFVLLSIGALVLFLSFFNLMMREWLGLPDQASNFITLVILATGLLYLLDFVTLSRLKQVRWLRPVYFPVYRFFSLITLAFLYRPLYYNLIDTRFGRRVGLLLVPYILSLLAATSFDYSADTYFPALYGPTRLSVEYYDDLRPEEIVWRKPSIPSRYVGNGYIELFLPYNPGDHDEKIEALCPGLAPARTTGLRLFGGISQEIQAMLKVDSLLWCMSHIRRIYVDDSLHAEPGFRFYEDPESRDRGLLTILDVDYLPRGEHILRIETRYDKQDSVFWYDSNRFPFWKE